MDTIDFLIFFGVFGIGAVVGLFVGFGLGHRQIIKQREPARRVPINIHPSCRSRLSNILDAEVIE